MPAPWRPQGYVPDRAATDKFVSSLKYPTMAEAGPKLKNNDNQDVVLYPAILRVDPLYKRTAQAIGSCVGHGWAGCGDALAATEIVVHGEAEDWKGRILEASIYGVSRVEARGKTRAGTADGSFGAAAAKAVMQWGVLHYGVDYGGTVFKDYSGTREKQWGDTGMPDELEKFAKQRRIKTTTLVTDFDSYCKAISSGFPVAICSGQGFTMSRSKGKTDDDIVNRGFATPRGEWLHCMAGIGKRGGKRPGGLIWNSWGIKAHTGPHYSGIPDRPDDIPAEFRGSTFWVDAEVLDKMLKSWQDSFALSSYDGFPPRKLPSWTGGIL